MSVGLQLKEVSLGKPKSKSREVGWEDTFCRPRQPARPWDVAA